MKLSVVSLGCDKNTVDTEMMLGDLQDEFEIINTSKGIENVDIVIVNTCGFIESAKQESINTILDVSSYKNRNLKMLIVTGCLSQRYGKELLKEIPEIDLLFGVNDYNNIQEKIKKFIETSEKEIYIDSEKKFLFEGRRHIEKGRISADVKISEGCNNKCTYCAIPKIRGSYRSRKIENIVDEVIDLVEKGIVEINLVAQDTTRYGIDLYGSKMLVQLIKEISKIEKLKWIRLFYAYPEEITDELILEFKNNKKLVKYIDMPIQHINDRILKLMGRKGRKKDILNILNKFKSEVKNMSIRTTFIVGFPSETEDDINELLEFIKLGYIKWLGTFIYSKEENTIAYNMENQIEEKIKLIRQRIVMEAQRRITSYSLKKYLNRELEIIVTDVEYSDINVKNYIGRTEFMAKDVDGEVIIQTDKKLELNSFYKVKIINTLDYDLKGVIVDEFGK